MHRSSRLGLATAAGRVAGLAAGLVLFAPAPAAADTAYQLPVTCKIVNEAGFSLAKLEVNNPSGSTVSYQLAVTLQAGADTWTSPPGLGELAADTSKAHVYRPFGSGRTIDQCTATAAVVSADPPLDEVGGAALANIAPAVATSAGGSSAAAAIDDRPVAASDDEEPALMLTAAHGAREVGFGATGGVLELHLGTAQTLIDDDSALTGSKAGLFIGRRGGAVTFGVGLELLRLAQSTEYGGTSNGRSATQVLIMPGIRFTTKRSRDRRVEIFGEIDLGLGKTFWSYDDADFDPPPNHKIVYQLAPGLRYWAHPKLAIGAVAGLRGEFFTVGSDSGDVSSSTGLTSLFSNIQVSGLF